MNYTASLLFRSEHDPKKEHPLWEERLVLISAPSEEDAMKDAAAFGRSEEHEYKNESGGLVRWHFVKVERVFALESTELTHRAELFCRFLRDTEAESILQPFPE